MKWKNRGHEFDDIGKKFENIRGILIYGAGEYGVELHKILKGIGVEHKFVDNYHEKKKWLDVDVITSEKIRFLVNEDRYIVVLAMGRANTAVTMKQLMLDGMVLGENLFEYYSFIDFWLHIVAAYRYNKCYLYDCAPQVINTCTLRCEKCMSALPYLKRENCSMEQAINEIDILFSKIDFICNFGIGIGEGFLHKDLDKIIEYTMKKYMDRIGKFVIVTNGTVLPNERILKTIKRYGISVRTSVYSSVSGWEEKYKRLCEILKKYEIDMQDYKYDCWSDMGWADKKSEKDVQIVQHRFDNCGMLCRGISNGKLIYCIHSMAANQALYQLDIENDELDLSVENENIKKIIMEYDLGFNVNGALTMCQFCNGYVNINKKKVPVATQLK